MRSPLEQIPLFPRVAQRDALSCKLALDFPLTNCHLFVLELYPSAGKQADSNDEIAHGGHSYNLACLL